MDIANYLSELLGRYTEISVPGLGCFSRLRVNGYYDDIQATFYPPGHKLHFDQEAKDDEILTRHIAEKKKISLASSKYFTEKYISNLRLEIMAKEVVFADLGTLYFADGEIRFKPAADVNEPVFYGYPPITLNKIEEEPAHNWDEQVTDIVPVAEPEREPEPEVEEDAEQPVEELPVEIHDDEQVTNDEPVHEETITEHQHESVYEEPVKTEEPAEEETVFGNNGYLMPPRSEEDEIIFHHVPYDEQEVQEEEIHERNFKWIWITILTILIIAGAAFAYVYFKPFENKPVVKKMQPLVPKDTVDSVSAADTLKTVPGGDTSKKTKTLSSPKAQNTPAQTIDSTKRRYEVIGVKTQSLKEANNIVANYKSIGIIAHVLARKDVPRPLYKISLGTCSTYARALEVKDSLLKTKKVRKDIEIKPINPKK